MLKQQPMVTRRQFNGDLAGKRLRLPGLEYQPVIDPEAHAVVGADGESVASGSREVDVAHPAAGEMISRDGRRWLPGPQAVEEQVRHVFDVQHRSGEPVVGEELTAPGCRVLRAKDLDAIVKSICYIHCPFRSHRRARRQVELPIADARHSPRAKESSASTEVLDAVVVIIRHVDCPVRSHCHAGRPVELPIAAAWPSPRTQEGAGGAEALDTVVPGIRHVDRAVGCHCYTLRIVELPITTAQTSPRAEKGSGGAKALNAVVVPICHVNRAIGCYRHALRVVELPYRRLRADSELEDAVGEWQLRSNGGYSGSSVHNATTAQGCRAGASGWKTPGGLLEDGEHLSGRQRRVA